MLDKTLIHTVPDPSELTTEQLHREIALLEKLTESRFGATETRFSAMDKAITLLQVFADKSPTTSAVAQSVACLGDLTTEKFRSIETQFKERDSRTEQTGKDSKIAVDAALAAAKEAVAEQNKSNALSITKSENAFTKQMDGIAALIVSSTKASDDKINDIKDRLTAIESSKVGFKESTKDTRDNTSMWVSIGAVLIALVAILLKTKGL